MTRKQLTQAIKETSLGMEFCFHFGFEHRMGESIIAYPALWLAPPKAVAMEGCREGRVKYRVVMHLMELCSKATAEEKDEILCRLEEGALGICRTLGLHEGIASASLAECAPAEFSLTNHGEISMCLKLDVEVPFCNL